MDPPVLGFSLLLSVLTGVFFGVFPALAASRSSVNEALREGGKGSTPGLRRNRARGALVIAEVALALILLIGAGLLVRSFQHLRETDPGFAPEQILSLSLSLPESQYAKGDSMRAFHQQLQSKLQSLPGVRAVGQGTDLPLAGANWTRIFTAQDHPVQAGDKVPMNAHTVVSGNYFEALGIPLKRGRLFTAQDGPKSAPVLVVNETMARRIWPGEDPIGKRIKWGPPQGTEPWQTIVGIVGDSKQGALDQETMPHTYESYLQANDETGRAMSVAVRAAIAPASLTTAVRARISSLDRELPIAKLQTMEQAVTESMAPRQFNMMIVVLFASAALLLAALGIYGVMAYSVTQRTQEIGVRMALGARRADVLRMVVGQALALAGAGVVIGLACAYGLTRLMEGLLFGVKPTDPITFVGISLLLLLVALLATYLPARRATQVDPMVALRCE